MKLITGLFRAARKRLALTCDNDMGMFRDRLNELIEQKDTLSDEEIAGKVEELKGFINDLPESDDKAKLGRFLDDFKAVKEQDVEVAKEAGNSVAELFERLDKEAMQDVPETSGEETVEDPAEETLVDEGTEVDQETEEVAEETLAPETEEEAVEEDETTDADPDPEYTLEEIYQFIKKRMAEDAEGGEAGAEEVTEEEVVEEDPATDGEPESLASYVGENVKEDVESVKDCAPRIPVTVKDHAVTKGGLADMFAAIKNGGVR